MPTEAMPGERQVVLAETLTELEEVLEYHRPIEPGLFSAIEMLITDAVLDGDDETLSAASRKLNGLTHICKGGVRGQLRGYIGIIAHAQRRIIPKMMLEQLADPGNLHRRVLAQLSGAELRMMPAKGLCADIGCSRSVMEVALHQLNENGLVASREIYRVTCWEITPKGRHALRLTRP